MTLSTGTQDGNSPQHPFLSSFIRSLPEHHQLAEASTDGQPTSPGFFSLTKPSPPPSPFLSMRGSLAPLKAITFLACEGLVSISVTPFAQGDSCSQPLVTVASVMPQSQITKRGSLDLWDSPNPETTETLRSLCLSHAITLTVFLVMVLITSSVLMRDYVGT